MMRERWFLGRIDEDTFPLPCTFFVPSACLVESWFGSGGIGGKRKRPRRNPGRPFRVFLDREKRGRSGGDFVPLRPEDRKACFSSKAPGPLCRSHGVSREDTCFPSRRNFFPFLPEPAVCRFFLRRGFSGRFPGRRRAGVFVSWRVPVPVFLQRMGPGITFLKYHSWKEMSGKGVYSTSLFSSLCRWESGESSGSPILRGGMLKSFFPPETAGKKGNWALSRSAGTPKGFPGPFPR